MDLRQICLVFHVDEFECQSQRSKSPGTKKYAMRSHHPPAATEWNALTANNVMRQQMGPFRCYWGGVISAGCMHFMFGKTSLARSSFVCV